MATPANDGGTGGPLRRRPFRRAAVTPYDRPPTALRGVRGGGHVADSGGWISKLFDPASRLIASGASRLFSSMFQKRLTAPPSISEEDHQSREDVSQIAGPIPSSEIWNSGSPSEIPNGDTPAKIQNSDKNDNNQTNNSDSSFVAKLEQLLEQKTFTRVESDRLAELLRSRMVETENVGCEKEKVRVLVQEDGIRSSRIHSHKDEAGSPEELAKAYMGSRPSKVLSVGKYDNQVFQEDARLPNTPSMSKRLDLSATPRSGIRFSGIPEQSEGGYRTERPPGRSAIYRMSRSPYFKVNPTTNIQVGGLSQDGSSCQWTPSAMKLHGRQSLKRGNAALDREFGSVGPIRRIRQKSGLLSYSKVPHSSLSGKFISNHSTPAFKDVLEGSTSVQKTLLLDERKYVSLGSEAAENGISSATMIPSQSSETAQKLFQQLDKLLPSPKEKSAEPKMIARDESPSKLTLGMLHGNALRSMEDIPSSKFFTVEGHGQIGTSSASPNIGSSHSLKLDMVKENGPDSVSLGMKSASEANGVSNVLIPSEYVKHGVRSENIAIARNVGHAVPKKPAFQMSAPEDSFELDDDDDDDDDNLKDSSVLLTTAEDDGDTKTSKQTKIISERVIPVIPESPTTSSQGMPVSSSESLKKADKKPVITPVVTEKSNGFAFPVSSDPFSQFQSPPTPTMAIPQSDGPEARKEQTTSPIFSFGSNGANSSSFSSSTSTVNDFSGIKFGEGLRSKPKSGTSSYTTTSAEGSALDKNAKETAGDIFKPFGNTVTSGISTLSTPPISGFGTSAASSLSNGSLHSSSPAFPVPGQTPVTLSEGSVSMNNTATASSSSSLSVSSAAATFSTVSSIQFASDISKTSPVPASQLVDGPNSPIFEANSIQSSPLHLSSSTVQGTSSVSLFQSVPSFNSGSSSSALLTPVISSGMGTSSGTASLFSSTGGMSSSAALSPAFPSTASNVFGFNSSTQSTSSIASFANSASKNSTTTIFGATGGATCSSPLLANNPSQNSTANTTSATGVSIFGTQSTQPGSGTSQITQSSTSQFGSFSSSTPFGFVNSSSGGFGASSIAPAISDAQAFSSGSGFSFSSGVASCAGSSSSFAPVATSSLFGSNSQPSTNTSPSTGFSFGTSSASNSSPFIFSSSSGSSTSTFAFGGSSGSSSSSFKFGSSSGSGFAFNSAAATASSTPSSPAPVFGISNPAMGLVSSSPGNDQMNEDSMTDDTNQAGLSSVPTFGQPANNNQAGLSLVPTFGQPANNNQAGISSVPTFGQPANNNQAGISSPPAQSFIFGSPAVQPGAPSAFQFGGNQNLSFPQNPSPFQPTANVEFTAGGSFSLGSGGGDKSGRRYVKVKRDKLRRK